MIMSNIQCPFGSLDCDYTKVKHKEKNKEGNFQWQPRGDGVQNKSLVARNENKNKKAHYLPKDKLEYLQANA
jgi:hypothetical protein